LAWRPVIIFFEALTSDCGDVPSSDFGRGIRIDVHALGMESKGQPGVVCASCRSQVNVKTDHHSDLDPVSFEKEDRGSLQAADDRTDLNADWRRSTWRVIIVDGHEISRWADSGSPE